MFGQGSPIQRPRAGTAALGVVIAVVVWAWICPATKVRAQQTLQGHDPVEFRIRMTWGGGPAATWTGTVRPNNGQLSDVSLLSLADDAPGSVLLREQAIHIAQKSASTYGGFDATYRGLKQGSISIVFASAENPDRQFIQTIPIEKLLTENVNLPIGDDENRIVISRSPGDQLQVQLEQDHLVFRTGELIKVGVAPRLTTILNRQGRCQMTLTPARKDTTIWSHQADFELDEHGSAEMLEVELPLPEIEGVYTLHLELDENWYQAPFASRSKTITRKLQMVVLSDRSQESTSGSDWEQVLSLDAVAPVAQPWSFSSRDSRWPLGNEKRQTVNQDGRQLLELGVGGWQVVPISVDPSGAPFQVDVEFLESPGTAIGFSVLQQDSQGQVSQFGFDSGVTIPQSNAGSDNSESSRLRNHRFPYWANGNKVFLLIANRSSTRPARIGQIRVLQSKPSNEQANPTLTADKRKLMAFYEKPLFAKNFASDGFMDSELGQPLDDWVTFYEGARRFIHHLKSNSYRGAFVAVASDGSSIYPSQLLSPTPKYDTGAFFQNGQDPFRKDVLEMLFRMFERENLLLVPTVCLSQPLPQVENSRGPQEAGRQSDLVDFRGVQRNAAPTRNLPIYNPLDPKVQGAVTRIISELSARYRHHDSFDSVSIVCRPDTYSMIPGRTWCYDNGTITRFISTLSHELRQPYSEFTAQQFRGILLDDLQQEWLQWRTAEMSSWYAQMLAAIRQHRPQAKLILAPVDAFRNLEASSALAPSLHQFHDFDQVMLELGLDHGLDARVPGVVVLKPQRFAPREPFARQRVEINVEDSKRANLHFNQKPLAATIITHRSDWAHFVELQSQPPFEKQVLPLMRRQPVVHAGEFNRQRFTSSLRNSDTKWIIDGGSVLSLGQEQSANRFASVFSQLPDVDFHEVGAGKSDNYPVICRQARVDGKLYFYLVNDSPWPVRADVLIDQPGSDRIVRLGQDGSEFELRAHQGKQIVSVQLEAFDLVAGVVRSSTASVIDLQYLLPPKFDQPLRNRLRIVQAKLNVAAQADEIDVLQNPDFFDGNEPTLLGWYYGNQPTAQVRLDLQQRRNEPGSLLLANDGNSAVWVRSNPFAFPATGRLSISVWLKTDRADRQPQLRIAIEGNSSDISYYRFGSIENISSTQGAERINQKWQRFAVHFDDLPTEGLENLRVGFDLMGPGRVWIDNVQVYDRWLDENDAKAITQMLATASRLLDRQETADKSRRILQSYWPRFLLEHFSFEPGGTRKNPGDPSSGASLRSADISNMDDSTDLPTSNRQPKFFQRFRNIVPPRVLPFR